MTRSIRYSLGAMALALVVPSGSALAMTHVSMANPIRVSDCNPSRNVYMSGGYSPAFYPVAGPYWGWPSVYGYNYYQYPVQGHPTLSINYTNVSNVVMSDIEFGLVAGGRLVAEVRDVGTFSPGAEIKHEFGLNPNVFPLQTSFTKCVPLRIKFANGTKWKNPHLPALQRSIYARP